MLIRSSYLLVIVAIFVFGLFLHCGCVQSQPESHRPLDEMFGMKIDASMLKRSDLKRCLIKNDKLKNIYLIADAPQDIWDTIANRRTLAKLLIYDKGSMSVTDERLLQIQPSTTLGAFTCYGATISDVGLVFLERTPNVFELRLSQIVVSPVFIEILNKLERLDVLEIADSNIRCDMSNATFIKRVRELVVDRCQPAGLAALSKAPKSNSVRILSVSECGLDDSFVNTLLKFPYIEKLNIEGNGITDRGLKFIAEHLWYLREINCYGNKVTDSGIEYLSLYRGDILVTNAD